MFNKNKKKNELVESNTKETKEDINLLEEDTDNEVKEDKVIFDEPVKRKKEKIYIQTK